MPKKTVILLFFLSILFSGIVFFTNYAGAAPLLTINGEKLSQEDFFVWWKLWQEDDSVFSDSLEDFLDWSLEAQEAKRMALYEESSFKHKINVFLKARTLVMLRYDEVESKINIQNTDLQKIYQERYTPTWNIRIIQLATQDDANSLRRTLLQNGSGALVSDKIETIVLNSAIVSKSSERTYRPTNLPAVFKETLAAMKTGGLSLPIKIKGVFLLIFLEKINSGDDNDFQQQKSKITELYRRELQNRYTNQLIVRLKKKYHVEVDKTLLAELDPLNPEENSLEKILIKTDRQSATVAFFLKHFNNNIKFKKRANLTKSAIMNMKYAIVNTIIAQNLTTWESLSRHYERVEPFKDTYEFYRQNRLIAELKNRIIPSDNVISEAEIRQFYQKNIADYSRGNTAVVDIFEGDYSLIRKIWLETLTGGNFDEIIKKYDITAASKDVVLSSSKDKELWHMIEGLDLKSVSSIEKHGRKGRIIRLLSRITAATTPLAKVRGSIEKEMILKKRQQIYADFLTDLKQQSKVSINRSLWRQILKDYTQKDD